MNLTLMNGLHVKVDKDKIDSFGPHVDGGSAIIVNGNTYHVEETVEQIMKLSKDSANGVR